MLSLAPGLGAPLPALPAEPLVSMLNFLLQAPQVEPLDLAKPIITPNHLPEGWPLAMAVLWFAGVIFPFYD